MNPIVEEQVAKTIVSEEEDAVTRGALYLDEHLPGWYNNINLAKLNIRSSVSCIIGQLEEHMGDYTWARDRFGGVSFPEEYGFDALTVDDEAEEADEQSYRKLQHLWTEEIQRRRAACHQL